jgi:hypothetical protein
VTTPRPTPCPDAETLARASSQGPDAALHTHLIGCARCRAVWEGANLVRDLGRLLARDKPRGQGYEGVRAGLLHLDGQARASRRRRPLLLVAGAVGAALAVPIGAALWRALDHPAQGVATRPLPTVPALAPARLEPGPGARWKVEAGPPLEVVRLAEGTLRITVDPAGGTGRSLRVIAPDAEVEVRGTVFEASVAAERLTSVRVERGQVVVRPRVGPPVDLSAGKQWAPAPEVPRLLVPGRPTAGERAFQRGLRALEAGYPAAAARDFARAGARAGEAALAEEAAYWRSVALSRAGNPNATREALVYFLRRFPGSPRAGELSVMLGSLLLEQGHAAAARKAFLVGMRDPSPRIQRSAREGLEAAAAALGAVSTPPAELP